MTQKMDLHYFTYPSLKLIPQNKRGWACWYYYTLAQKLHEQLGESTDDQFGILEHERWMDPHFEQIARTVAMMYGFSDPGEFMQPRFWDAVKRQAYEMHYPAPAQRIMHPLKPRLIV